MRNRQIILSEFDAQRLMELVRSHRRATGSGQEALSDLETELERAIIVDERDVPRDAVVIGSRVEVLDLERGTRSSYSIVLPAEADLGTNRISVLAPLGTALLGYRTGDEVEWSMPGGLRRLRIEGVAEASMGGDAR